MASIDTTEYAEGTSITFRYPFASYVRARVLCVDGVVRPTVRIAASADTFFSVPCAVKVKGKTVAGFLTIDDSSASRVVRFHAYAYGKNGNLLPEASQ